MALTLDPVLAAAQESRNRSPIIELISTSYLADIPFDGAYFNDLTTAETKPNVIVTSTGRVVATLIRGGDLYMLSTNPERTEWTETLLVNDGANSIFTACPVELADLSIGVIYGSGAYVLKRLTVDADGSNISASTTILSLSSAYWIGDAHVSRQPDGIYRLVYSYRDNAAAYAIMLSTSADWTTWSTPGAIPISGMTSEYRFGNPSLLWSTAASECFLWFDHVDAIGSDGSEITNVYYQLSDDYSSWTNPEALTEYNDLGSVGYHPSAAERTDGKIEASWTEKSNVLHITSSTNGYQYGCNCEPSLFVSDYHIDYARNKLIIKSIRDGGGNKSLCSIVVFDIATWAIDRCYTSNTVPAINPIFCTYQVWPGVWWSSGQYAMAGLTGGKTLMVCDTIADTIVNYQFNENADDFGLTKNVSASVSGGIATAYVDADTDRLYVLWIDTNFWASKLFLGYIDLTASADAITGLYPWTLVGTMSGMEQLKWPISRMKLIQDIGVMGMAFSRSYFNDPGGLFLMSLYSGGLVKSYYEGTVPGFPTNGVTNFCYWNGKIYAAFNYSSAYDQVDKRGLMEIDLATDAILFHQPTYKTADDYGFGDMVPDGIGNIIIGTSSDGVVIFNTADYSWTRYNNQTLPGLALNGSDNWPQVAYDPLTGTIFTGSLFNRCISAFSIYGAFYQGFYKTGEYFDGWEWSEKKQLDLNHFDYENSIAIDETNGMWTIWTRRDNTEQSAKWDNESGPQDISKYIVSGTPATVTWSVESSAKLDVNLSHGHLFDTHNQMSLLSGVLAMGRLLTLRLGATVDGVDYWQNQGTFVVKSIRLQYQRGSYPTVQVAAEDISTLWDGIHIVASEDYSDTGPEYVLEDLVETFAMMDAADVDVPSIENAHNLFVQFVDRSLMDAIQEVLDHFGYFCRIDVDGKFSPKCIDLAASVSHAYPDTTSVLNFSPDGSYSTFTNRVTVTGESHALIEVLYDEEVVGAMSGTIGWWGEKTVKRIYYSEDRQRTCRNPRLEIIQSVNDFWLFKYSGGGTEYLSNTDYYETWVEITIEGPNLVALVITEVAVVIALGAAAISCEPNCGYYIFATNMALSVLLYTLACVASYSYQIWARPIGHEKQTIEAQVNDEALQQQLNGQIVESRLDDPLCYEVAQCQMVADYELSVVQAQRNRITMDKIADLRDEIIDVISIPHPYSNVVKKILLTDIRRSYTKPDTGNSGGDGGLIDSLSGWVL